MNIKKWTVSPLNKDAAAKLCEELGIPSFLAMLLETRGLGDPRDARALFDREPSFFDPLRMTDMDRAAERIRTAVDRGEKIAVYGDYDADGVTSTAMLYSYLDSCGASVSFYIPEREGEGYGLNRQAIETLRDRGVRLIVTVDNGISSAEEIDYAASLGLDVVVTDHHRPQPELPRASAVVDPYRPDCAVPFRDFSGVGVAFKLIAALEGEDCDLTGLLDNYADLVAIGTVGDVVPLLGENRLLVRRGLELAAHTDRVGLQKLLELSGAENRKLTAGSLAFTVVPRINATGRMGSPDRAVRLLVTEDPGEAEKLAQEICADNDKRREVEGAIYESALDMLRRDESHLHDRVLVVAGENWHHGVVGIVASRLVGKFGRPCIVVSYTGDEAKGSGRSVEGFSLFEAVSACAPLLTKFGGHPMAAGLSLPTKNIGAFREAVNRYAASLPGGMPLPEVRLDLKLNPAALSVEMPKCLDALEPFGTGNPAPVFGLFGMRLCDVTPVGNGKHLRLSLSRGPAVVSCMRFHTAPEEFPYEKGDVLDLAVTLEVGSYRGEERLSVFVRELRLSGLDYDKLAGDWEIYEKWKRGESLAPEERESLLPDREDFAALYRFLRAKQGFSGDAPVLLYRLGREAVGLGRLLVMLEVLGERGLADCSPEDEKISVTLREPAGRVDLFASPVLNSVKGGNGHAADHQDL